MTKIYPVNVPETSLLKDLNYTDYTDGVGMQLPRTDINVDDVVNCFFTDSPSFVAFLMRMRDAIVKLFGLKTGNYTRRKQVAFEEGKEIGLFKMFQKNDHEAIIGTDDKHLNFRVSLFVNPGSQATEVIISTVVHYHNKWGKMYMAIVRPFHKIVVHGMIKKMQKTLTNLPEKTSRNLI